MKYALIVCAVLLAGCGVESLETAATAAALKQQELEQGERMRSEAERRIDAATAAMRQRQGRMEERASRY